MLLLCLIFARKSMSSIDCSETALSNKGDVWRFLILHVVREVLDLATPEATICLVAFDVLSLLFFKLEKISFGISYDYEFITASCIAPAEFGDWELTTAFIATAFFDGDFSQLMLSVISLILLWVVVERFLHGNLKFWFDLKRWILALLYLSVLLCSWSRIALTWITSFPLSFRCVLISFFAVSIFQSGTKYFLIWSVCKRLPFVLFVPFSLVFLFFIC